MVAVDTVCTVVLACVLCVCVGVVVVSVQMVVVDTVCTVVLASVCV